jgi:hypothetical protein
VYWLVLLDEVTHCNMFDNQMNLQVYSSGRSCPTGEGGVQHHPTIPMKSAWLMKFKAFDPSGVKLRRCRQNLTHDVEVEAYSSFIYSFKL